MRDHFSENTWNGLRWPHTQILVAENQKLLYCPIAKNACTSLKRLIVSVSNIEPKPPILAGSVHENIDRFRTGLKLLDHDLDRAQQMMEDTSYFKFAVVRDPFSRLVSAYVEKFVRHRTRPVNQVHTSPVVAAVQRTDAPDFRRCITFAEFVEYITAQEPATLDPHWKPQTLYLLGVDYDRIYRMDELDSLRRDLESRVGRSVEVERMNRSNRGERRFVSGAAHLLPGKLRRATTIDKHSFMESELTYRIVNFFANDYDLYYRRNPAAGGSPTRVGVP